MKRLKLLFVIILLSIATAYPQKVGLVLSGGGAKGIAHIGVLKALEENDIPIDYIAGTSMGAIVGGMYAMGYSPEEIADLLKSDDFKRWSTGEVEPKYNFYYQTADKKPFWLNLKINIRQLDSLNLKKGILPTNLVPTRQMNYAFVPLFAQADAVSNNDFNKLFIPFRCVASDVYNKKAVVLSNGILGDAIRASMTFPFMYKPITIDNELLFDGGIYNNFPTDVMKQSFNPDFMIGSVVASNPKKPTENDIIEQVQNMIISSKSNYGISPKEGFLFDFKLTNYTTFDFSKVDELVKLGYDSTMAHIDELKARIHRRALSEDVVKRRFEFRQRFPEFKFKNIRIEGVDTLQKQYIERVFHKKNRIFGLDEFKESYFRLISDDKVTEVIPHAHYDDSTHCYDLDLKVKAENQIRIQIGGNISSSTSNQAYLGITYQNLTYYAQSAYIDAQFGRMYNGLGLGTRIDLPSSKNLYLKLTFVLHKFDYFNGNSLFYNDTRSALFTQSEGYSKFTFGVPLNSKARMEAGIGYGAILDKYIQNRDFSDVLKYDKSEFSLGNLYLKTEAYTLNNIMYPTDGYKYSCSLQMFSGSEEYKSASDAHENTKNNTDTWLQFKANIEKYIPLRKNFVLGTFAELLYSNRKFNENYTISLIEAPVFQPTPHSKTVFNGAFSANQYGAIGIIPIYKFSNSVHVRGEGYWFIPYKMIINDGNNKAVYSDKFDGSEFISQASVVLSLGKITASAFVNYYSTSSNRWNFGVNIGLLLFNDKFKD